MIPQPIRVLYLSSWTSSYAAPEAKCECHDYKPVIRAEKLCTPLDLTVLHGAPLSTVKNEVDFILQLACVGSQLSLSEINL